MILSQPRIYRELTKTENIPKSKAETEVNHWAGMCERYMDLDEKLQVDA
mgnify:CR=1 FL=1